MRKYLTTLIIWASLMVNELHSLWETSSKTIVAGGVSMPVQWYVWFLCNSAWGIMMAAAMYFYAQNRINRTTILAYLLFCCADIVMFLYNYKQEGYESVYTILLISWILIYNHGDNNRQGIISKV